MNNISTFRSHHFNEKPDFLLNLILRTSFFFLLLLLNRVVGLAASGADFQWLLRQPDRKANNAEPEMTVLLMMTWQIDQG